ncbi:MAG: hypothetical protein JWO32_868 [Bacteroidetes bacterium]|nr:hypothetical protein [Bacteroidota bacterium]
MRVLIFTTLTLFLFSCSSKFNLQKRKYTKGYYFGMVSKKNKPATQTVTAHVPEGKHSGAKEEITEEMTLKKESKAEETMPLRTLATIKQHKRTTVPAKIITASASKKTVASVIINSKPVKALNPYLHGKQGTKNQHYKPFDAFGSGMGILSIIGIISGIISVIAFLFYLIFFLSLLGVITSYANALWIVGVLIIIAVAIGLVVLANSD